MKVLILSDVHSNIVALEAIWAKEQDSDMVYCEIISLHDYEQFRQARFGGTPYQRLILGHTHRQAVRYLSDDLLWLNPGSVSYRRPDDPDQTAHYATIVDGRISLHRLTYDLTRLYQAVQAVSLSQQESQSGLRFFGPRKIIL